MNSVSILKEIMKNNNDPTVDFETSDHQLKITGSIIFVLNICFVL